MVSSTWEDFTSLLPAVDAALPVVTKEIGDSWCDRHHSILVQLLLVVVLVVVLVLVLVLVLLSCGCCCSCCFRSFGLVFLVLPGYMAFLPNR